MSQPVEPQGFPIPTLTWEDVKAAADRAKEREAHLIQCTAELGQGLELLRQELRARDFRSATDTVAKMKTIVELQDALLGGRRG